MATSNHFIEDGHQRARAALEQCVRAEVIAEFETRPNEATLIERLRLRIAIHREVERRIAAKVPPDGLY